MKTYYTLLFNLFLFFSVSLSVSGQGNLTKKQTKFVSKFVGAVNVQKQNKVYKMIFPEYRKNYKGSKKQLLSEVFAGKVMKTKEFTKVPFRKISDLRVTEIREVQEGITLYLFIFNTIEGPVELSLYLKNDGKKMGFQPFRN